MNIHSTPRRLRSTCECCADMLGAHFDRRSFLHVAAGSLAAAALLPTSTFAAGGKYEAMVLSCIDPRFQSLVTKYGERRQMVGKYSQFTMAGAAIGVVAPAFKDWHKTFWDNLGASIQLHGIERVIAINHRDCGAAKIAYGADAVANAEAETKTHAAALAEFRKQMAEKHPKMAVETLLMALDGKAQALGGKA
jgi:carbonic anhydrase